MMLVTAPALSPLLDLSLLIGLFGGGLYSFVTAYSARWQQTQVRVWLSGMALLIALWVASLFDPASDLIAYLRLSIAYPITTLALLYWLYRRFGEVSASWADMSLIAALILLLPRLIALLPRLYPDLPPAAVALTCGAFGAALCSLIIAAHGFRPLSDRSISRVMSAPYAAVALILFALGSGFHAWMAQTGWSDAARLTLLGDVGGIFARGFVLCVLLGMGNQIAAELRGQNRRVTGWVPFWLVSGGIGLQILGLSAAGLAQTFLWGAYTTPPPDSIERFTALANMISLGGILTTSGLVIYLITMWLRRPRSTRAPHDPPRR